MDTTIKIKADTSQATSSLKSLQTAAREISQNLRLVKSDLNFDAGNIAKLQDGANLAAGKVKVLDDEIRVLTKAIQDNRQAVESEAISNEKYAARHDALTRKLEKTKREQSLATSELSNWKEKLNEAKASSSAFSTAMSANRERLEQIRTSSKNLAEGVKLAKEALKFSGTDGAERLTQYKEVMNALEKQAENTRDEIEALEKEIEENRRGFENGAKPISDYEKEHQRLNEELDVAKQKHNTIQAEIRQTGEAAGDSGNKIKGFWESIKTGVATRLVSDGIKAAFHGIGRAIASAKEYSAEAISMASSYEDALGYSEQVFGDFAEDVEHFVEKNTLALRMNKLEMREAINTYGGMFRALSMNKDEAYKYSSSLVQLAADMSAATGIPVAQVLENLQSVMTGGAQAGYKYGLVIKETGVKLKALQMGLVQTEVDMTDVNAASLKLEKAQKNLATALAKHGEESFEYRDALQKVAEAEEAVEKTLEGKEIALDEATKAQARYALIMEQSATMHGQAERESGNYNSQLALMRTNFDNLKISIGEKLLPVANSLLTAFNDFTQNESGKAFLDSVVTSVGGIAEKTAGWVLSGDAKAFADEWIPKIVGFAEGLVEKAPGAVEALGSIGSAISAVADAYGWLKESADATMAFIEVKDEIQGFADKIQMSFWDAKGYIEDYAEANELKLSEVYENWGYYEPRIILYMNSVVTHGKGLADGVKTSMSDSETALTAGATAIDSRMSEIETSVSDAKDSVSESASGIASGLQTGINEAANVDTSRLENRVNWITGLFETMKSAWRGVFSALNANGAGANGGYTPGTFYMGMASGGNVKAGVPYIVGERGQELFIPRIDGRILNHQQTQQVLNQSSTDNSRSFGDIHIHVHSRTSDSGRADGYAAARGLVDELKSLGVVF